MNRKVKKMGQEKKSPVPKPKKIKPRNAGTMTESAFWSYIRAALRQKSMYWKPINNVRLKARRVYKGPLKRQKFEYKCNVCGKWFSGKDVSVDHIVPAGVLNCADDLPGFVERLFCEESGLQLICNQCHNKKSQNERNNI